MKPVSNFLIYLAQNCIKRSLACPNDFRNSFSRYISIHCEKYSSVHFCTRRHVVNFLWSSNIGCVFCGSEQWKRTKLNGKVSDSPDRISKVLNVPLSNINVDGYICNERSYRDLKCHEKILEDAKSLQQQSLKEKFTTNNRTKRCVPFNSRTPPSVSGPSKSLRHVMDQGRTFLFWCDNFCDNLCQTKIYRRWHDWLKPEEEIAHVQSLFRGMSTRSFSRTVACNRA